MHNYKAKQKNNICPNCSIKTEDPVNESFPLLAMPVFVYDTLPAIWCVGRVPKKTCSLKCPCFLSNSIPVPSCSLSRGQV